MGENLWVLLRVLPYDDSILGVCTPTCMAAGDFCLSGIRRVGCSALLNATPMCQYIRHRRLYALSVSSYCPWWLVGAPFSCLARTSFSL